MWKDDGQGRPVRSGGKIRQGRCPPLVLSEPPPERCGARTTGSRGAGRGVRPAGLERDSEETPRDWRRGGICTVGPGWGAKPPPMAQTTTAPCAGPPARTRRGKPMGNGRRHQRRERQTQPSFPQTERCSPSDAGSCAVESCTFGRTAVEADRLRGHGRRLTGKLPTRKTSAASRRLSLNGGNGHRRAALCVGGLLPWNARSR